MLGSSAFFLGLRLRWRHHIHPREGNRNIIQGNTLSPPAAQQDRLARQTSVGAEVQSTCSFKDSVTCFHTHAPPPRTRSMRRAKVCSLTQLRAKLLPAFSSGKFGACKSRRWPGRSLPRGPCKASAGLSGLELEHHSHFLRTKPKGMSAGPKPGKKASTPDAHSLELPSRVFWPGAQRKLCRDPRTPWLQPRRGTSASLGQGELAGGDGVDSPLCEISPRALGGGESDGEVETIDGSVDQS